MVFAIINGFIYSSVIGEWKGHVVNSLPIIEFVVLVTYLFLNNLLSDYTSLQLILLGFSDYP